MKIALPALGKAPVPTPHFPTAHQAFLFRAWEFVPPAKIAALLGTTEENVRTAAAELGLGAPCESDIWLKKGYISIIRSMWHILPYDQLLQLLEMDEDTLAITMREDDFLDHKLQAKPLCQPVAWRELTEEEAAETRKIKAIMEQLPQDGVKPFHFSYDVAPMEFSGKQLMDLRMVYGFSSVFLHAFDMDSREYCPDEMLEAYQKVGVNALWFQGVLHQLTQFPFDDAISKGWQDRLARLKELTERCAAYGIQILLYINEPRSMPANFYDRYPHLRGHEAQPDKICMCTSTKEVQDYIENAIAFICREVPLIGGFFSITRSENITNCFSHSTRATCTCPRCSQRQESEVIAEVIGCMERGAHKVDPNIKIIAWSWEWKEFNLDIINALPDNVIVQCQSELNIPINVGGVPYDIRDYSMSVVGPGERAKSEWRAARERGLKTCAKIQVNTTWEGSTVPAIPVYPMVEEHIRRLQAEGVTNLMMSWTLGGYPSRNIMHAAKYFYESAVMTAQPETPAQQRAAEIFSEAFQSFPFSVGVAYKGPQNGGPSNLLYLEPTGYKATMTCFAYDDLKTWSSVYSPQILEDYFGKLVTRWEDGLKLLDLSSDGELEIMAQAAWCIYSASLNQIRFYLAREAGDKAAMLAAAEAEEVCARKMLELMNRNATIGFEAANHYYFTRGGIREKILNCRNVIEALKA